MRIATPLAAALTFATAITVTLDSSADRPRTSRTGSVAQAATAADAVAASPRVSANRYSFFPPNRRSRIAVTWDRDLPVTYLIARRHARPRMFATIEEAFRRARLQTGIRFRYGGRAATSRPVGTADQPVVIVDFGTARSHPRLAKYHGGFYAVGGPLLMTYGATSVFTGGQITIDVRTTKGIGRGFRHGQLGETLLHEVGHVLGLAHVNARRQLMAPGRIRANVNGWFQDGDLRGLRRLIHD
ncbi:MAG TPA: matrixin family metalloprotease [Nocardioides sp.]|nr:matrixin family metalloprotease [Nocardioides sp.]